MHTQMWQKGVSLNAGQPHVPTSTKTRWLCANVPGTYNDEVMGINDSFPSLSGPIAASARSDSMNFCCAPLSCPSEFVRYSTSCKKKRREREDAMNTIVYVEGWVQPLGNRTSAADAVVKSEVKKQGLSRAQDGRHRCCCQRNN